MEAHSNDQFSRENLFDQCRELAESKSVLSELGRSLKHHGFAGSTNIPELIFLALITRVFARPVSAVIKGPSSSGKSFSLHAAMRYVPKTAYEEFQGLSDRALVYSGDLDLRHRHIVIGEAAGLADGNGRAFFRQLLTEDEIRYRTVQQTSKEGHVGKEFVIKGPVGLLMTTTANSLHWEDETRLLSLHVDQSPDQIKRALMAIAGDGASTPSEDELSQWHALYDYVINGPLGVEIPFQQALLDRVPCSHGRVLRDIPKVLALLRAHALLHQATRECKEGKIVAELDDYKIVYDLVAEPLAQGLEASVPPHIREVVDTTTAHWKKSASSPISITELAEILGRDPGVISRNVTAAVREGYLDDHNPGQGKKSRLVPGDRKLPANSVLPSPEELFVEEEISIQPHLESAEVLQLDQTEWETIKLPY